MKKLFLFIIGLILISSSLFSQTDFKFQVTLNASYGTWGVAGRAVLYNGGLYPGIPQVGIPNPLINNTTNSCDVFITIPAPTPPIPRNYVKLRIFIYEINNPSNFMYRDSDWYEYNASLITMSDNITFTF